MATLASASKSWHVALLDREGARTVMQTRGAVSLKYYKEKQND